MLIRPPITLQAGDWCWLRGKIGATRDSAVLRADRMINLQVANTAGLTFTTNVSIDSIPGKLVLAFYQALKTANAGEIVTRYTAINSALSAVTQLSFWYGFFEANLVRDYEATRNSGKNFYVDQ
jgi:hypothetical protein